MCDIFRSTIYIFGYIVRSIKKKRKKEDSFNPLFKAVLYSVSWLRKLVKTHGVLLITVGHVLLVKTHGVLLITVGHVLLVENTRCPSDYSRSRPKDFLSHKAWLLSCSAGFPCIKFLLRFFT